MTGTHLDLRRFDAAPEAERAEMLAHLRACGACRSRWLRDDPARIFALLAEVPVPPSVLSAVSRGVASAIDRPRVRAEAVAPIRFPGVAAWAASLLLCLATGWLVVGAPSRPVRIAQAPAARAAVETHADVELLSSPGEGRVVDLTVGDTQVVMIFDSRLEL
jgi:hypothetical protein